MDQYLFYLEFDGKHTISNPFEESINITSSSITDAVHKLAKEENLKLLNMDYIKTGEYRAFFAKKRLFKEALEVIFYIKTAA